MNTASQARLRLTDQQIIKAVKEWFLKNVDESRRRAICDEARHQVVRHPSSYVRVLISKSLEDVIEEARPSIDGLQSRL